MEREPDGEKKLRCPKCQGRMFERALKESGVRVDCCPSCRGMWFERGELQEHSAAVEGKLIPPADTAVSKRFCPACQVVMSAFRYSGSAVVIDLCEECRGVWLDVGELGRLGEKPVEEGGFLGFLKKAIHDLTDW